MQPTSNSFVYLELWQRRALHSANAASNHPMHQERTSVRSYNLPASRSLCREQSGRQHAPKKSVEAISLSGEFQMGDWIRGGGGVDLQPKVSLNPFKTSVFTQSGAKNGAPQFRRSHPPRSSKIGVLYQLVIRRQSLDGVVVDNQSFQDTWDEKVEHLACWSSMFALAPSKS